MILLTMILTKYYLIESIGFSTLPTKSFIFLTLLILFTSAAGYIINDIYDIEADKINKPNKLYISKTISKKAAWKIYFIFTFLAAVLSILFSTKIIHWLIFLGTPILLWLYSNLLKQIAFIGNIVVAFLVTLPIYIIYLFDFVPTRTNISTFDNPIFITTHFYILFAFLTTIIREIIKDIEDVNGDKKLNMKTIPILLGRKRAKNIVISFSILLLFFMIFTMKNLVQEFHQLFVYSIVFVLVPLGYFYYKLYSAETKKDYSFLSALMKIIMFFGILSMFLFKFI